MDGCVIFNTRQYLRLDQVSQCKLVFKLITRYKYSITADTLMKYVKSFMSDQLDYVQIEKKACK